MPKKRKAQGLSINTIILVVIGLIVLVVIIAVLTSRMGLFSKGLESAASCENACKAFGEEFDKISTKEACSGQYVSGFSADKEGEGCCCKPKSDVPCTKKYGFCSTNSECCSKSCVLAPGDTKKTCT